MKSSRLDPVCSFLRLDRQTNISTVADAPMGYPMLARLTASAPDFYIFREFRYLQSRVLLQLQDELRALETQLWRMDEKDRVNNPSDLCGNELSGGRRKEMLARIQQKLVQYGQFLKPERTSMN